MSDDDIVNAIFHVCGPPGMLLDSNSSLLSNTGDTDNMCQPKDESTIHFQLFNVEKTDRIPI